MKRTNIKTQIVLNVFFIILSILIVLPFLLLIGISLSNERDIVYSGYHLIPEHLDFSAYRYVFKNPTSILDAYKVTGIVSVLYMGLSVLLMALLAYPLTQKEMAGRRGVSFYIYFTMLFNGGLVPTYILITQYLHLNDTLWVYILPGLISPWYVFMMRTFFQGIPKEIVESGVMDGANEYVILFRLVLPLSTPVLATVALFMFLTKWNDWMTAMLYINNERLISLQYLLQRIMNNIKLLQDSNIDQSLVLSGTEIPTETVRMAMAVVVAGPVVAVFPFFQKYFVQGLTVGSVKG